MRPAIPQPTHSLADTVSTAILPASYNLSVLLIVALAIVACATTDIPVTSPQEPPQPLQVALVPSVTPIPTDEPSLVITPALASNALFLTVNDAPVTVGYDRDDWRHWSDDDSDCQNARHEVLVEESLAPVGFASSSECRVVSGEWRAPFTGSIITDPSSLDVDHMVPLANAHRSGGWAWDAATKKTYANDLTDPGHLIAVTASANRSKGSRGPEEWLPSNESYICEYIANWARIKAKWQLTVTSAELAVLLSRQSTCGTITIQVARTSAAITVPPTATIATPTFASDLRYDPAGTDRNCGDFGTWKQAQDFFEAAGGPGSDRHRLDGNSDGIACDSLKKASQ